MEGTENDGCTPDDDMMIVRPFPDYPLQSAPEKEFFRNAGSQFSMGSIKDGNSICLFSIPVRLMEGVIKNILRNVRSNMCPLGIFPIDRYSFGL